jgi:glycosyltransferase involved in cell wall biosynthesis
MEATSSGLPVVVAAGSGSERFVVEGKTGLVAREATPQAWAKALSELLRDPQRAAAMGRDAHAWSLANAPSWHEVFANDLLPAWRAAAEHHELAAERAA